MWTSRALVVVAVALAGACGILTPGGPGDGTVGSGGAAPDATGGRGTIDVGVAGGTSECDICTSEGPACVRPHDQRICLTRDQLAQCDPELGAVVFGIALCPSGTGIGEGGASAESAVSDAGAAGAEAGDVCPRVEDLTFGSYGGKGCGACKVSPLCPSGPALHVDESGEETDECCYLVRLSCGIC